MAIALRRTADLAEDFGRADFAQAVVAGLSSRPKSLPCRFFYDARGSELFEQITELPEYYPTRTETAILERDAARLVGDAQAGATLVEFGSGSSRKTESILRAGRFGAYIPIDVSRAALADATNRLRARFPALDIEPLVADFSDDLRLPPVPRVAPLFGFFPGSTIGNFAPEEAARLLRGMARLLGRGGRLIIGVDLQKDRRTLEAAYDDSAGVTAAFNLNLLVRMRRELAARVDIDGFAHRALYNERLGRIEMHLVSLRAQEIDVAGRIFAFDAGETIHTENSYKYTMEGFGALAACSGWVMRDVVVDEDRLFGVISLEAE
jgi:dimethylhistidine N-methyltransferase